MEIRDIISRRGWLIILCASLLADLGTCNPSRIDRPPRQSSMSGQQRQRHEDTFCDSQGEGFHSHPSDCAKFVRCVEQGTRADGTSILTRFNFYCAPGTVFDSRISVCNFPYAVGGEGCHSKTAEEIATDSDNSENEKQDDDYMDKVWTTTTIVPTTATTTTTEATPREHSPEAVEATEPSGTVQATTTEQFPEKEPRTDETTTTESPLADAQDTTITTEAVPTTTNMCQCNTVGTVHNKNVCDVESGQCLCKKNVQGRECDQCSEGHFNLEAGNVVGCTACFCFGHSSTCESASGFNKAYMESTFERGTEYWRAENEHGDHISVLFSPFTQDLRVDAPGDDGGQVYFVAPGRFIGDQHRSFNRHLNFTLRITEAHPLHSSADIILEGGSGDSVTMAIFGDMNPLPSTRVQKYSLVLHPKVGWKPVLTEFEFNKLLSNLTAIKIRGTYTPKGTGYLDNVFLETARRDVEGPPATWVENCTCPEAYTGQFCQHCAAGYTRAIANTQGEFGSFVECVSCNCSGRSTKCDPEFGTCVDCPEGTTGEHCEACADGYFFNATTSDCEKCPCKEHEPVCRLENGTMFCYAFFNVPEYVTGTTAATTATVTVSVEKSSTEPLSDADISTTPSSQGADAPTTTLPESLTESVTTVTTADSIFDQSTTPSPMTTTSGFMPSSSETSNTNATSVEAADESASAVNADYTEIDSQGLIRS